MPIDKKTLINEISDRMPGVEKDDIHSVLDILVDEIQGYLWEGNLISLSNFGQFSVRRFPSRSFRNVRTGEIQETGEYSRFKFKLSRNLKNHLKNK